MNVATCPNCMTERYADDPQPQRTKKYYQRVGANLSFSCPCGQGFTAKEDESALTYRWLKSVGMLPERITAHKTHTDLEGYIHEGKLDLYVRPRIQRVLARIQN